MATKKKTAPKKAEQNQPITHNKMHKYCKRFAEIMEKGGVRNIVVIASTQDQKGSITMIGSIPEILAMMDYERLKILMRQYNNERAGDIVNRIISGSGKKQKAA